MHNRFFTSAFLAGLAFIAQSLRASELDISVLTADNKPLAQAVVYVESMEPAAASLPPRVAIMDQRDKAFAPHILAVPVNTKVDFPNTDSVNHYVYSFSEIKKFQFKLFKGDMEPHQMMFDKPGLVTLGCNIHDSMLGYIFVAPTAYVGVTDAKGKLHLTLPDKGDIVLAVWHELANENLTALDRKLTLPITESVQIRFTKSLKSPRRISQSTDY